jgi:hypothetical protein
LDRVLQQVVVQITAIFHFDMTRIYLFDAERESLLSRALCFDTHPESWSGVDRFAKRARVLWGQLLDTGRSAHF